MRESSPERRGLRWLLTDEADMLEHRGKQHLHADFVNAQPISPRAEVQIPNEAT
eukprot:CAMPEP_0206425982 /NCGR_PEP_ID=MMETSP0324_2-20121206/4109_1 /ASSEMBLY_ACC=CAM_ASM_000836 /TAXON_ID=2866 /ORGANISM="Crypthecodinium cohnii, Strain Seligo" /LENGTH=53 /DNA_ID=CAMNT_0053890855 /DNA_START=107 /DNA_END=264 /DNA_ORIENTATION=-